MREIPRIKPLSPTGGKSPIVPWAIAASTAIFIVIMLGASNQYLARFQQPYSFDATSEVTVELIDASVVLDLASKPDVRNQFGNTDGTHKRKETDMKLNDILESHFNAIGGLARLSEIRNVQRSGDAQLTQWNGQPMNESGRVEIAAVVGKKSYTKTHFEWYSETAVWNGTEGWKSTSYDGTTVLSAMELEIAKQRTYITPFQRSYEQHGSSAFQQREDETFYDKGCFVIQIIGVEGVENTFYYIDKTSHLLIGIKEPNTGPTFNSDTVIIHFSDYAEYNGVMFWNSQQVSIGNNELNANYTYTKTEIDVALDETIFEKP